MYKTNANHMAVMATITVLLLSIGFGALFSSMRKNPAEKQTMTGNDIYKKCISFVTQIEVFSNGEKVSSATGTIWDKDDNNIYIMTNYHVVKDDEDTEDYNYSVIFNNKESASASLSSVLKENDIAIISVAKADISEKLFDETAAIEKGDSDTINEGDHIYTIGNALGDGQSITDGIVSAKDRNVTLGVSVMNFIQISAPINDGTSGGPLIDSNGLMVGMITGKVEESASDGIAYALPVNQICESSEKMKKPEQAPKASDGLILTDVTEDMKENGVPYGVYVKSLPASHKFSDAGVIEGDVIVKINDKLISKTSEFNECLSAQDGSYSLEVLRRDDETEKYENTKIKVKE